MGILLDDGVFVSVHSAMRVGWQEWSQISFSAPQDTDQGNSTIPNTPNPGEDKSTDWWDTDETAGSDSPSSSSLPLDSWLPFQPHDTGSMLKLSVLFLSNNSWNSQSLKLP
jgi:hypothetical protein